MGEEILEKSHLHVLGSLKHFLMHSLANNDNDKFYLIFTPTYFKPSALVLM